MLGLGLDLTTQAWTRHGLDSATPSKAHAAMASQNWKNYILWLEFDIEGENIVVRTDSWLEIQEAVRARDEYRAQEMGSSGAQNSKNYSRSSWAPA